jgi:signal peptidase I
MSKLTSNISKSFLDLVEVLLISGTVAALMFLFVGQPVKVVGDSMLPSFANAEQLVSEKVSIKYSELIRGDVVIFEHPMQEGILLIKRVVGMPGEKFEISDGKILINDRELVEKYTFAKNVTQGYGKIPGNKSIQIPKDGYILLGDNRENSSDSREWGVIHKDLIVGKGFFVYYPFGSIRAIP